MPKYQEIVGGPWEQRSLFPESVPHLFHHDMTYLWVLEQQRDQRPKTWLSRVEAWKLLFRMFLLEQVSITREELRAPFMEMAERFGIRSVTWLKSRQTKQPIGVLSPTVIVRPLPDFADGDLERWRAELKDHEVDFNHLAHVAVKDLRLLPSATPYALRIADILQKEFELAAATNRPPAGTPIAVPILNRLTWEIRSGDTPPLGQVNLLVRSDKERPFAEYIPYCVCGTLLLQEKDAPAIEVDDVEIAILCPNTECKARDQRIPLEFFGIWLRNSSTVVRWVPNTLPPMPGLQLPPDPSQRGSQLLEYEWNKAAVGGESQRRFLSLSFVDRRIEPVPLMSVFFDKLLVAGPLADFHGSAMLPDWGDALDTERSGTVRVSQEMKQVEFRGMKIRGWPVTFSKFYKESSLHLMPELSVGLFPDPSVVGPGWKWYRAFAHGTGVSEVEISGIGMTALLSNLATTETGLPTVVSVVLAGHGNTGVSFSPILRAPLADYGGTKQASLGVDFGTTNTVVYHQPPDADTVARPGTHGLNPRELCLRVLWLANAGTWSRDQVLGHALPGPGYRNESADPYLIPSEIWRIGRQGHYLIRWSDNQPEGAGPYALEAQFKWDHDPNFVRSRLAYLKEVVLLALPTAIAAFAPAQVTDVQIGFAYPLAFEHESRDQFRRLLDTLAEVVRKLTGLAVNTSFSINESEACVNAFGAFNADTFLVADMGGGTLDVALFSMSPATKPAKHQMGSLRFAGERCVKAMAEQLAGQGTLQELREAIARGDSHKKFAKLEAEKLASRFATIAFEFIRTMVAAYRRVEGKAEEEIKLVLVGNGWHLVEAFSREVRVRGAKNVYLDIYEDMVEAIGDPHLVFYTERPLTEFPSSKHLVVAGTLQNVTSETTKQHELVEASIPLAQLPAGRSMTIHGTAVQWFDLVGEGVRKLPSGLNLESTSAAEIKVSMDDVPGPPTNNWRTRFAGSVRATDGKIPYPSHPALLRELKDGISGSPPKLKKGPLQLILETEWSRTLTVDRGGSVR